MVYCFFLYYVCFYLRVNKDEYITVYYEQRYTIDDDGERLSGGGAVIDGDGEVVPGVT